MSTDSCLKVRRFQDHTKTLSAVRTQYIFINNSSSTNIKDEETVCFRPAVISPRADSRRAEEGRPCLLPSASHHGGWVQPASWYFFWSLKRKTFRGLRVENLPADSHLSKHHQQLRWLSRTSRTGVPRSCCHPQKRDYATAITRIAGVANATD